MNTETKSPDAERTENFERLVAQEMLIESVTEKLLELMGRQDVSKADLARRVGKSRAFITQVMDGSRNMTLRTVADLAFALGYELRIEEAEAVETAQVRKVAGEHQIKGPPSSHGRAAGLATCEVGNFSMVVVGAGRSGTHLGEGTDTRRLSAPLWRQPASFNERSTSYLVRLETQQPERHSGWQSEYISA